MALERLERTRTQFLSTQHSGQTREVQDAKKRACTFQERLNHTSLHVLYYAMRDHVAHSISRRDAPAAILHKRGTSIIFSFQYIHQEAYLRWLSDRSLSEYTHNTYARILFGVESHVHALRRRGGGGGRWMGHAIRLPPERKIHIPASLHVDGGG